MRILGIDPGIGRTGWGVIDDTAGKLTVIAYDCFETTPNSPTPERLVKIFNHITFLIEEHKPEALGIEELFFNTNVTTAFTVGQARGVILLAAEQGGLPIGIYTPLQVKMAVTGYGRAEKKQVGDIVKLLLKLKTVPKPDDTADALAIAITHAFSRKCNASRK
jgi:crossover junction endodeoxyribonuclease RuvC